MKAFYVAGMLALALLACNLSNTSNSERTSIPQLSIDTETLQSTQTEMVSPSSTDSPAPTSTLFTSSDSSNGRTVARTFESCTQNTSWFMYVVVRGDNLGSIASRTGSTVDALVAANCLSDPNAIFVGQTLYVPREPANTPVPAVKPPTPDASNTVQMIGVVRFDNALATTSNGVQLVPGRSVTITYDYTNPNGYDIDHVDFLLGPSNGIGTRLIGRDGDIGNSASIIWTVEAGITGEQVYALAYDRAGFPRQRSSMQPIYTNQEVVGRVRVEPVISQSGGSVVLEPGQTVTLSWPEAGSIPVTFSLHTPTGIELLGTDANAADGTSIQWQVPARLPNNSVLSAGGQYPDGRYRITETQIQVSLE